jgi:hypothetical protein
MSGIFSSAAHCALQYFPSEEIWQVQGGWAHFFLFSVDMESSGYWFLNVRSKFGAQ